jgi:hypothetical protein
MVIRIVFIALVAVVSFVAIPTIEASGLLEMTELLSHPEQYDRQMVVVVGRVTNVQTGATMKGEPGYGFLLKDSAGTVKVVGLGRTQVQEGDQVIVEGVFTRLRQSGRKVIYNEIKASQIRPIDRLNPDLVG